MSMRTTLLTLFLLLTFGIGISLAGCEKHDDDGHDHDDAGDHSHDDNDGDDHDHADGDDDGDHEHADDEDGGHDDHDDHDDHDGHDSISLGSITIDGTTYDVAFSGDLKPGEELHVDVEVTDGEAPASIRLWLGEESGVGSMKSKGESPDGHFHVHVEVPDMILPTSKLWLQTESKSGERKTKSFGLLP